VLRNAAVQELSGQRYTSLTLALDRGAHACHLYSTANEQKEIVLRFLTQGLKLGECCNYIAPDGSVDDWYFELQTAGIDVLAERQKHALLVLDMSSWVPEGNLNSAILARRLWRSIARPLADFPAVRLITDMGWALARQLPPDQLCHWEATTNLVYEDTNARAICQYDLVRHGPQALSSALRTHPTVIFEGRVLRSPFYEAPRILAEEPNLNHSEADASAVARMLEAVRATP